MIVGTFFKKIFITLNIITVLALITAYLSVKISPAVFCYPAFFGLAYPYILFANILFILGWLFFNPIYSLLSLSVIIAGYSHTNDYFQFVKSETEKNGLEVLSYNVQGFWRSSEGDTKHRVSTVAKYLEQQKSDIICLQEATHVGKIYNEWKKDFNTLKLPTYVINKGGQVIMSNFPIINSKKQDFKNSGNNFIYADIVISKDTVRVYNCHLQSYAFTSRDIGLLDSISMTNKSALVKDAQLYINKLSKGFIKRAEQVGTLRKSIDDSPYPVIVCGDFNDTPVSYTYHTVIGENLFDAFVESGNGLGSTYNGKLPSFRIDYIFHDSNFKSFNFQTEDAELSDHYPIKCRLLKK